MSEEVSPYDELAAPLGSFIIAFNELELAVGAAIMNILDQEERVGAVFVALLPFSMKLKMIRALDFKIKGHPYQERFTRLVNRAQEINDDRNKFIHAEYWPVIDADTQTILMAMRRIRDATKPYQQETKPKRSNTLHSPTLTALMGLPLMPFRWPNSFSLSRKHFVRRFEVIYMYQISHS
jgi:hypothetical protein